MHAHCFHLGSQLITNYQTIPIFKIPLAISLTINIHYRLQDKSQEIQTCTWQFKTETEGEVETSGMKKANILVPLIWIGPETPSETYDLSKISWTTVPTDSHSTFIITSNIECIIS
jgi:hypothetical protein